MINAHGDGTIFPSLSSTEGGTFPFAIRMMRPFHWNIFAGEREGQNHIAQARGG
jgi:hypothetical protein